MMTMVLRNAKKTCILVGIQTDGLEVVQYLIEPIFYFRGKLNPSLMTVIM